MVSAETTVDAVEVEVTVVVAVDVDSAAVVGVEVAGVEASVSPSLTAFGDTTTAYGDAARTEAMAGVSRDSKNHHEMVGAPSFLAKEINEPAAIVSNVGMTGTPLKTGLLRIQSQY